MPIVITLNGEKKSVASSMSVADLLRSLGIKPEAVAVEQNLKIVARSDMEQEMVEDGDALEVIRFVGGG